MNRPASYLHASVSFSVQIPAEEANRLLRGTDYEDRPLGAEPDHDREAIGEILDERVAERFHDFLDYMNGDPEVECDW